MEYDLVLEGRAVTPKGLEEVQIGIEGWRIARVKKQGLRGPRRIVAASCIIFPGFIDTHVHLRAPGWEQKEDFATGTAAAAHGGVTTVFDMPNNPTPATNPAALKAKAGLARSQALVDVKFLGGVGKLLRKVEEIRRMVVGYKLYMAETTGSLPTPPGRLRASLAAIGKTGKPASVHCESQSFLERRNRELAGQTRPDLHADLRPPEAEVESVRMVLGAQGSTKLNVCHVSTSRALELVGRQRAQGLTVACEVALHHLFFSREAMLRSGLLKMNPPLRSEADRRAMLEGLRVGKADFLVTDHAPHTLEEKRDQGACGVPGLDNYSNVVSWLVRKHGFNPETVAAVCSGNQARFFGLEDRGVIEEGKRADFAVLDLKSPETASSESVKSRCGWTPYEGYEFPGRARWTICGGRPLVEDFDFVA